MRSFLTAFSLLFICCSLSAQTFTGTGGAIPGTSTSQTCFTRNVTGVGNINGTYGLASVCINITHPNDDELEIVLTAPDGTVVPLTIQNGGSGNNYTNTCFSATATNPIKFGTAPFTGSFLPEGYLGAVNNGQNANGAWRLCIQDRRTGGNAGTLNSWSLTFNNTPAPVPPILPSCANTLPSTSSCSTAALVCDFNGQCGTTSGTTVQDWPGSGLDGPCFGLQNNSFIRFIAAATTASFSVWVPTTNNTAGTYNQGGIQMLFFSGTCNSGPVTTYGCYPHIFPYSGSGQPLITVVSAAGLTPGNTYYLMIDGFNNDNCTFTIAANTGVNVLNITPPAPAICAGESVNLTASGGNGTYSWSPATNLNTTSGTTVTANPPGTTTYTVTSNTVTGCPLTKDVTVTVNPLPVAPTASVTAQPTCIVTSGTITITAPTGAGFQYSIGGAYQPSPVFPGLPPGPYNITVQNAAGCTSAATMVTVNGLPPTPPAPTVSVTAQPTCNTLTGTITITAPTGAGLLYSIGGPFQASPVFSGLTQNVYNVTVQNAPGCISQGTSVSINAAPTPPAAPTASVTTQPTCTDPTGTITITAPTGAGLEYSVNGTTYQASPIFSNLNPNTYSVTVRNTTSGCTSAATLITIGAAPAAQPGPLNIGAIQPTCTNLTGTILITPPAGSNLEFSINGTTYQASTTFGNVPPGVYSVTVRNTVTGCVSVATSVTVDAPPTLPTAPVGSVTIQPSCTSPGGEITITAPLGSNYEYSLSAMPYQPSPVFGNLSPGVYFVTVRNIVSGCVSPQLTLTVNDNPVRPQQPVITTTQPDCTISTGSITVTSPLGAGLEYSTDGNVYQSSPVFGTLPEGTYLVRVRNAAGCVSPITAVIILDAATQPAKPVITQVQPSCPDRVGSITVNSPVGATIEYSINGTTYQSSNFFGNLPGGHYQVTARFIGTTCVSAITDVEIFTVPPQDCETPVGTDIYFPSAFTPNGDNVNDGFGPGPKSNLGTVINYSLMVFNRYGEMIFKTNNPLQQWNGFYKGKMLANNTYTWVAKYSFAGSAQRIRKGTVLIIR